MRARDSLLCAMIITKVGVTRDDATLAALFDRMSALTQRVRAARL